MFIFKSKRITLLWKNKYRRKTCNQQLSSWEIMTVIFSVISQLYFNNKCSAWPEMHCIQSTNAHIPRQLWTLCRHSWPMMVQLMIPYFIMLWKQYAFSRNHISHLELWSFSGPVICGTTLSQDTGQW